MDSSAANSRNPVVEEREPSDAFFAWAWLFISIPVLIILCAASITQVDPDEMEDEDASVSHGPFFDRIISITKEIKMDETLAKHMFLHSIYVLLCILLINFLTTPLIFIGMIVNVVRTLYTSYALTNKTINGYGMDGYLAFAFAVWIIVRITSTIAGLASLCKIDMTVPRNVIRNSCRVIIHSFKTIILFAFFLFLVYLILTYNVGIAHGHLRSGRRENIKLLIYSSIALAISILLIWYHKISLAAISHYTVDYYWKNDEKPRILQSVKKIYMSNGMTISIAAVMPIPWLCAIDQAAEHSRPQGKEDNIIFYLVCKTFLIASMPFDALIFTAIYGTGFAKSSQMAFDLVLRRCKVFLATTWVIETLLDLIAVSYFCIDMLVDQDSYKGLGLEDTVLRAYSLFDFASLPYPTYLSLLYFCARALLINQIIILNNQA